MLLVLFRFILFWLERLSAHTVHSALQANGQRTLFQSLSALPTGLYILLFSDEPFPIILFNCRTGAVMQHHSLVLFRTTETDALFFQCFVKTELKHYIVTYRACNRKLNTTRHTFWTLFQWYHCQHRRNTVPISPHEQLWTPLLSVSHWSVCLHMGQESPEMGGGEWCTWCGTIAEKLPT